MNYNEELDKEERKYLSAYRIVSPKWVDDAFSSEGARLNGGRWSSPGRAVVYLGGSRALAALEMLVHLTSPLTRAMPYRIIEVKIPRDLVANYPLSILHKDWRESPVSKLSQEIGDDWINAAGQLAIMAPSVLIPEETNILLNPHHPDFKKIQISEAKEFSFDKRL